MITSEYFKQYRKKLGFDNQVGTRIFFGAKDVIPMVDFEYLKILNTRLYEIIVRINNAVAEEIKIKNIEEFKKEHIDSVFEKMKKNGLLPLLNNQGRRPEQVYFSWMRGYIVSNFFLGALGIIFSVDTSEIDLIGDDNFENLETFQRTPKADFEIKKQKLRVEMQSGFTGINDIKQHKVLEAKRVLMDTGIHTLAIHFDLYNGQVAFVKLDEVQENDANWITRQQMEGQIVFNIDQNNFVWKITESPIRFDQLNLI